MQNKNPVEANYIAYHIIVNFYKTDLQLSQKKKMAPLMMHFYWHTLYVSNSDTSQQNTNNNSWNELIKLLISWRSSNYYLSLFSYQLSVSTSFIFGR